MQDSLGTRPEGVTNLVGRDHEISQIASFVRTGADGGGSLLVMGEAGVGKTALLEVAHAVAAEAGTRVVQAAGVEFEADVSFAGLNQLLLPLLEHLDGLNSHHRAALSAALGLGDPRQELGTAPSVTRV